MTETALQPGTSIDAPPLVRSQRRKLSSYVLPAFVWLVIAWTIVPIIFMIIFSFNQAPTGRIAFNWFGLTGTWYRNVFAIGGLTQALEHSLAIATLSSEMKMLAKKAVQKLETLKPFTSHATSRGTTANSRRTKSRRLPGRNACLTYTRRSLTSPRSCASVSEPAPR